VSIFENSFLLLLRAEEELVVLLCLEESLLEVVGVYNISELSFHGIVEVFRLTFAVGKADGQCLCLRSTLADIGSRIPYPRSVGANIW
jgi:hypothetical protein